MSDEPDDLRATPKRSAQRERGGFQPVAVQFLRRVLVPPAFVTATIGEGELTQNARARAKQRGFISGFPDLVIFQNGRVLLCELKWGKNKPSDAQLEVGVALERCHVRVAFCWSCKDILDALTQEDFALHANAWNLAAEYQERALSAVKRAELQAEKPHVKGRDRPSSGRVRRAGAIYAKYLPSGEV
jgi:hypothetical protein